MGFVQEGLGGGFPTEILTLPISCIAKKEVVSANADTTSFGVSLTPFYSKETM